MGWNKHPDRPKDKRRLKRDKAPAAKLDLPDPRRYANDCESFEVKLLSEADGRIALVKTLRERIKILSEEARADSFAKQCLVKRAVWLDCWLESKEIEAAETGKMDESKYTSCCNSLLGLLKSLGLHRRVREAEDLTDILDAHERRNGSSK